MESDHFQGIELGLGNGIFKKGAARAGMFVKY
jgi:hypothetical protein